MTVEVWSSILEWHDDGILFFALGMVAIRVFDKASAQPISKWVGEKRLLLANAGSEGFMTCAEWR